MSYSRIVSVQYLAIRKYQAGEMSFVTLNSPLFIVLQYFIMFCGIVLELVTLKISFYCTCDWTSILDLSYVGSYSLSLKMCSNAKFFHIISNSYNTLALCWLYMVVDLAKQVYNWGCIEENFLRHFNTFILFIFSAHGGFIKGGQYPMNLRAFINFTFFVQKQCNNTAELREWDYSPEPIAFAIKLLELLSFQFC